ncbi:uncharacterized protein LOC120676712 isoform X2 [Panicum virgatum]|uniref:uncharacterized protein LOC120676712 isoform X2 n=1 Tax=Panicum virgatum TaxID=38727 RepID=UPI0019D532CE|nr:uncharacterized protein LOC120676712 isoform X2 [Panicum virgatum]
MVGVGERESGSGARRWKTCGKRRRKFGSASGSGEAGSAPTSGEVRRSPDPSLVFPPSQPVPDHRAHLHAGHHHSLLDSIPPPPPTPSRAGSDPDAPRRPWSIRCGCTSLASGTLWRRRCASRIFLARS